MKIKLTWRIWLLIIFIILSLISIFNFPAFFEHGVVISSVTPNSTAANQGFKQGQIITAIDGKNINSVQDYTDAFIGQFNSNKSEKMTFTTNNGTVIYYANTVPNITVSGISTTNIKLGLDLIGGARALVKAQNQTLTSSQMQDLVDVTSNRLNTFGLTDLQVQQVSDLQGNNYMLIEIAGATPNDLQELISQQGKFAAKIGNQTVFVGGQNKDIASVCRGDQTCARVNSPIQQSDGSYAAEFTFQITLTPEAARRHAAITKNLTINESNPQYLSEPLDLYVDGKLQESLLISKDLQGQVTTQIQVQGSGTGATPQDAVTAAENQMHKLQTILITGSLPYKLDIVELDTVSPALGSDFTNIILIAAVIALIGASLVVLIRYRNFKSSLALILTSLSEILIILGVAALIQWNLDLPSIAGILATIGTGFDDQIVILDESVHEKFLSLKQRLKRAFAIIMGAYFTALVSMFPLLWAGAGLLKGFAFTTMIGITAGVFITRPAFSDIVRKLVEHKG